MKTGVFNPSRMRTYDNRVRKSRKMRSYKNAGGGLHRHLCLCADDVAPCGRMPGLRANCAQAGVHVLLETVNGSRPTLLHFYQQHSMARHCRRKTISRRTYVGIRALPKVMQTKILSNKTEAAPTYRHRFRLVGAIKQANRR